MSGVSRSRWFLSAAALTACVLLTLSPLGGAQPTGKETAKAIAKEWTYDPKGELGTSQEANKGSDRLYIVALNQGKGSFKGAWNHYAKKCGSDKKYEPKKVNSAVGETKSGRYVILDQVADELGQKSALFAYDTAKYNVAVRISESADKKAVYVSITVALH
jgi:hypothetical protein